MVQAQIFIMMAAFLFAAVESGFVDVPLSHENRIIGGYETSIYNVPWTASLETSSGHFCGGAIISAKWVLTAAHCTEDYKPEQIRIRVGSNSDSEGGTLYKVLNVMQHENYSNTNSLLNDISAVKTVSIIKFGPSVSKVALPKVRGWRPPVGAKLKVSGWGRIEGKVRTRLLRVGDAQLLPFGTCERFFKGTDQASQLCAGSLDENICSGDSGGPLVWGDVLVGLVSYSDKACRSPGDGYTDVTFYREWIKLYTGI